MIKGIKETGTNRERQGDAWNLREALVLLLALNLSELAIIRVGRLPLNSLTGLAIWSVVDVALSLGTLVILMRAKPGRTWADLGLHARNLPKNALVGVSSGLVIAGLVLLLGMIIAVMVGIKPGFQPVERLAVQIRTWPQLVIFLVIAVGLVPFKEELLFRGLLYSAARAQGVVPWGIALTSLIFAAAHGDLIRFIPLLVGGICLNLIFERSNSLYSSIIAHGVWNGVMGIIAVWR
ncbi:MAG TPA: type II CAAX endopeptidase family protein [Desulfobacteria bacterium]|nr:type II CAAX endopeptidase family protein [Desulfobacteria bacterium]